jgi:urease accessory protein
MLPATPPRPDTFDQIAQRGARLSPATGVTGVRTNDQTLAGNRASGHIVLSAKQAAGATRRERVHEAGALRVRCPGPTAAELEAMIVNTAGGMAGGDAFALDFAVGPDARLVVTSAAAEKVYRTLGTATTIDAKLKIAAGGALAWLPQETILFDQARLQRRIEVDLVGDARLLLAEAVIFGRTGMGERVTDGCLRDCWRVRRDGRLLHAETARIDGNVTAKLASAAVAQSGVAIASVLLVPADEAIAAAVRETSRACLGEVGVSAWSGLALVRLVAANGAALRHDLAGVLSIIRGGQLPRLWLN